jgi:hypothetical protein
MCIYSIDLYIKKVPVITRIIIAVVLSVVFFTSLEHSVVRCTGLINWVLVETDGCLLCV